MQQYNNDKLTQWSLKLRVLADSDTGYTYNFNVYLGKTTTRTSGKGLGYDVVMELTECLRQQGYHVYTDNFYTSPPFLVDLKQLGLLGCGTSANRNISKQEAFSQRNEIKWCLGQKGEPWKTKVVTV